jgi:hypothetical protein
MRLSRDTYSQWAEYNLEDNSCTKTSDEFRIASARDENPRVYADFDRFGNGRSRRSDFRVSMEWKDVQALIEKFCEAGHPDALALQDAMRLAQAAKELGWRPPKNAPQSN